MRGVMRGRMPKLRLLNVVRAASLLACCSYNLAAANICVQNSSTGRRWEDSGCLSRLAPAHQCQIRRL